MAQKTPAPTWREESNRRDMWERECAKTHATADKIITDIREAYGEGCVTEDQRDRVLDLASEYRAGTLALLASVYGFNPDGSAA